MSDVRLISEVGQMRVCQAVLVAASSLGLAMPCNASSEVQTQLVGVTGATVMVFVSQYLPPELKALENRLKATTEQLLIAAGLDVSSKQGQYLTIDVTGEVASPALCSNAISLTIVVAFSEPVRLLRAPEQTLPNSSTLDTWTETYQDVVAKSDLEAIVIRQVTHAVKLFCDNVEYVNRRAP